MASTPKILAQILPANSTIIDAYTVPVGKTAVVSNIYVCNTTGSDRYFRIAIAIAGAVLNSKQYIYYDELIEANGTFEVGSLQLGAGDIIRVRVDSGNTLAFNITGIET